MKYSLFKKMMYLWSGCFLIVGLLFIIAPNTTVALINNAASLLGLIHSIPFQKDFLWLSLAGSLMITLSYLSYEAGKNPENYPVIASLLICKLTSSLLFVLAAWRAHNNTYLLCGGVDFSIFLIVLIFYIKILDPR